MMDRKLYSDNFEKLLKENADGFRMYPSKKVWHGLYNDIHPGKRWPSITMFIMFLFSFLLIGHLNTSNNRGNEINTTDVGILHSSVATSSKGKSTNNKRFADNVPRVIDATDIEGSPSDDLATRPGIENHSPTEGNIGEVQQKKLNRTLVGTKTKIETTQIAYKPKDQKLLVDLTGISVDQTPSPKGKIPTSTTTNTNDVLNTQGELSGTTSNSNTIQNGTIRSNEVNISDDKMVANDLVKTKKSKPVGQLIISNNGEKNINTPIINEENKSDITFLNAAPKAIDLPSTSILPANTNSDISKKVENAIQTVAATKKDIIPASSTAAARIKKRSMAWNYYISPSVSYRRVLEPVTSNNTIILNGPVLAQNTDRNKSQQSPSIGLEAGTSVNYKLFGKVQFITGLQLNYARYNIAANNTHPTITSLELQDESSGMPYAISALSVYGNGTSTSPSAAVNLHNYSFQASLPIGLQYELISGDKVRVNLVGTFQPSFIISSRSYILSSDKRNYLTDEDLLRGWNMNAQFGSYFTFKSNNLNWQIGPQIRYQLLSSYIKIYSAKEHLLDYGLRVGVSKIIK